MAKAKYLVKVVVTQLNLKKITNVAVEHHLKKVKTNKILLLQYFQTNKKVK